ncbi:MAG TPA: serine/threonine-protein kinase [Gemmatimonadaceae bacterium]|nr:serine/threonine-protein kinase [Gemmatimonadaceae bacterium]
MDGQHADFIRVQAAVAGRYSLRREIGRGGMGVVYLAQDVALERPVALKVLLPSLASQPVLRERFLNEARTAAKLSHPNVIPIFAVDAADDIVFFAMAFIDGETLGDRVRSRGPVPATELAKILRDVGWALAYAHAQGVVHRDVKADNIIIERATGRALLADFGIARVVESTGSTRSGEILGTADYMSPEQAAGEVADHRSDIYSLGVVAWYALAGRLPFEAPTVPAMLAKHLTQSAPAIGDAMSGLPPKLCGAVDRCLLKNPADRFGSAEEFAEAVSMAMAERQEAPVPVRDFVKSSTELTQGAVWVAAFAGAMSALGGLDSFTRDQVFREVWFGLAAIGATAFPMLGAGMIAAMRKVQKAGYAWQDLRAGWSREVQRDEYDRAVEFGREPTRLDRVARWGTVLGWIPLIASAAMGGGSSSDAAMAVAVPGLVATFYGGIVALWRHDGRTALSRRLTGKFLGTSVGRLAFRVAGVGLDRDRLTPLATHRPTELGIAMAIDGLFDALPGATRAQLAELPVTVRNLERDAVRMRERIEVLNGVAAKADRGVRASPYNPESGRVIERREALGQDLELAREEATRRLARAVTALETIRIDLLRLTAGGGSVGSLTADLAEAREVSDQVSRLVAARDELESITRERREPSTSLP